jgi:hypothetical protein
MIYWKYEGAFSDSFILVQFGRTPLHKWKNKAAKAEILEKVKAKEDYRFHARQMLKGFRYSEWLESGRFSDEEDSDNDADLIGKTKRSRDTAEVGGAKRHRN